MICYVQQGEALVMMLCGGYKPSQQNGIARAKEIATYLDTRLEQAEDDTKFIAHTLLVIPR